jgi:hypothetical protein
MNEIEPSSQPTRKPSFTGDNVNQLADKILSERGAGTSAGLAKQDWVAYVQSTFRLSNIQKENLRKLPAAEVAKIQKALLVAIELGGNVQLKLKGEVAETGSANTKDEVMIAAANSNDNQGKGPSPTLRILHCEGDSCSDMNCEWFPDF